MHQPPYAYEAPFDEGSVYASAPSPARRRRIAVVLSACLATLALTAVVADRVAAGRAQSRIARAFQDGMDTPGRPAVHVRGFPVLTQLADGTLRHVDITAHDIPADGSARPLPVTTLTVGINGLKASGDAQEAHARAVEATAFLSYEDLSNALGPEISQDTGVGRVRATVAVPFAGDISLSGAVSVVAGNRIAFTDFRGAQGQLPAPARDLLDKVFAEPIALHNIPQGLHLRSVTATASGLDARFTGHAVTFRPDSSSA